MSYIIGCIAIFFLLSIGSLFFQSTVVFLLSYFTLFLIARKKNPFDSRVWLIVSWLVLFINLFSGVRIVPSINWVEPIFYVVVVLCTYCVGYSWKQKSVKKDQLKGFLSLMPNKKYQKFIFISGIIGVLGSVFVIIDLFYLIGLSMHGGDRRAEFIDNLDQLSLLTNLGMLMVGCVFVSISSLFFHGDTKNKVLAVFSLLALIIQSFAIAGKQGVFLASLFLGCLFFVSKTYSIKIIMPIFVKGCLICLGLFVFSYITTLSSERHGDIVAGDVFRSENVKFSEDFSSSVGKYLPLSVQNTFGEFFGYYGDQLGTFCERFNIENYWEKYYLFEMPPKVLEPFVFLKRQIQKIFPWYDDIFIKKEADLLERIRTQREGHYGLANWQTILKAGLDWFGIIGQIVVVFFHGYFSRRVFEMLHMRPSLSLFHFSIFNNIFCVYTTMMCVLGETCVFVYFCYIIFFVMNEKKWRFFNKVKV